MHTILYTEKGGGGTCARNLSHRRRQSSSWIPRLATPLLIPTLAWLRIMPSRPGTAFSEYALSKSVSESKRKDWMRVSLQKSSL